MNPKLYLVLTMLAAVACEQPKPTGPTYEERVKAEAKVRIDECRRLGGQPILHVMRSDGWSNENTYLALKWCLPSDANPKLLEMLEAK